MFSQKMILGFALFLSAVVAQTGIAWKDDQAPCNTNMDGTAGTGVIRSNPGDQTFYTFNTCAWNITNAQGGFVRFRFTAGLRAETPFDHIEVWNRDNDPPTLVNTVMSKLDAVNFIVPASNVEVIWNSDTDGINEKGFELSWTKTSTGCVDGDATWGCQNGGTCEADGSCTCPPGYFGSLCNKHDCDGVTVLTRADEEVRFFSPTKANQRYANWRNCELKVNVGGPTRVEFVAVEGFMADVEPLTTTVDNAGPRRGSGGDFVQVLDGQNILTTITGQIESIPALYAPTGDLTFRMITDSMGTGRAIVARYKSVANGCVQFSNCNAATGNGVCDGGVCNCGEQFYGADCGSTACNGEKELVSNQGIIDLNSYLPNSACSWLIPSIPQSNTTSAPELIPQTDDMMVYFSDLSVESVDTLSVTYCTSSPCLFPSTQNVSLTGTNNTPFVVRSRDNISPGFRASVLFTSDLSNVAPPVRNATVEYTNRICGDQELLLEGDSGVISVQGFQEGYTNGMDCTWHLKAANETMHSYRFTYDPSFDLTVGDTLSLNFTNGPSNFSLGTTIFDANGVYHSEEVFVRFKTAADSLQIRRPRGFLINWVATPECDPNLKLHPRNNTCVTDFEEFVHLSDAVTIAMCVLAAIGIAICLAVLIALFIYKDHRVIRASSFLFCVLMLIGAIIGLISVFFFAQEPGDVVCVAPYWFLGIGFVLCFSAMLLKNFRIWRIMARSQNSLRVTSIKDQTLAMWCVGVTMVEVIFLIIWTAVDRGRKEQQFHENKTYYDCAWDNETVWLWIYFSIFIILCAVSAVLAFLTRNVSGGYRESRYIGLGVYTWGIIMIVCVALRSVFEDDPDSKTVSICMGIILGFTLMVLFLFVPKFLAIKFPSSESTETGASSKAGSVASSYASQAGSMGGMDSRS